MIEKFADSFTENAGKLLLADLIIAVIMFWRW